MSGAATDYAKIEREVERQILAPAHVPEPTTRAYMIARAALIWVGNLRGFHRAAELAYKLADEFAAMPK